MVDMMIRNIEKDKSSYTKEE